MYHKNPVKQKIQYILGFILDTLFFPIAYLACLLVSQREVNKKNVLLGLMANNNLVFVGQALKQYGYQVKIIPWIIPDHERQVVKYDLDICQKFPRLYNHWLGQRVLVYGFFVWAVFNFKIFVTPFQNRLLDRTTWLKWWEYHLLSVAKKVVILNPYGSDIYSPLLKWQDKPELITVYQGWRQDPIYSKTDEDYIVKNRIYCESQVNCIIAALDLGDYLSRIDHRIQLRCVNTLEIQPVYQTNNAVIKILHAPNHRHLKGTDQLIAAVEMINQKKIQCELVIAEKMSHLELMAHINQSDIIVDQLLIGAYGRFAIESMVRGKPVICYLREDLLKLYPHWETSGIINANILTIKDQLEKLIMLGPQKRIELGRASRTYTEKYHSYDYIGGKLDTIIRGEMIKHD